MKKTMDRRSNRTSFQALNVANEVIRKARAGEKINLTKIQVSNGYSMKSARSQKALQTQSFRDAIEPVIDVMKRVHRKAVANLDARDFDEERMDSVVNVAKQMVHDTQLLSGKATENVASNVVVYGSDDFLALQVKQGESKQTSSP